MEKLKSCILCDKALDIEENQILDNLFIEMLDVLLINLNVKNPRDYPVCEICIEKIRSAFGFKTSCIETMDCLIPYIGTDGKLTVDLKTVYMKERHDEKDEKVNEDTDVCRLCMKLVKQGSGMQLLALLNELHFLENFEKYVPEVALFAVENPVICDFCLISLQHLSDLIFMTSCLNSNSNSNTVECDNSQLCYRSQLWDNSQLCDNSQLSDNSEFNKLDILISMASTFNDTSSNNCKEKSQQLENEEKSNTDNKEQRNIENDNRDIDQTLLKNSELLVWEGNKGTENSSRTEDKTDIKLEETLPDIHTNSILNKKHLLCIVDNSLTNQFNSSINTITNEDLNLNVSKNKNAIILNHVLDNNKDIVEDMELVCESSLETHVISDSDNEVEAVSITEDVIEIDDAEDDCVELIEDNPTSPPVESVSDNYASVYECDICLFKSEDPEMYGVHEYDHMKYELCKEMTPCTICNFKCRGSSARESHMLAWHKDSVEKQKISCRFCKFSTDYAYYFKEHLKLHKYGRQYHECKYCSYKSKYRDILKLHLKLKHRTETVAVDKIDNKFVKDNGGFYSCPHCHYKSTKNRRLFQHVQKYHGIYKCETCDYTTIRKYYYDRHYRAHLENKLFEFKCEDCGFESHYKTSFACYRIKYLCKKCWKMNNI